MGTHKLTVLVRIRIVLIDGPSGKDNDALLALAALPPVLAEAATAALLALTALPPVLADASATALLALTAPPPVLADASAAALLAFAALPPVLARLGHPPPQGRSVM